MGLVVLGAVVALVVVRPRTAAPLDPDLLVVAPFDARGASLVPWGEGVMEYLSRSLDAAGSLRTVSPSVFIRAWNGRADAASARALGRRTGAGLAVFGSLVQGAGDSVRLRATLLGIGDTRVQADVEVEGDTLGMDRLVDSLAVRLLRELGRTRPVGAVRNAPFGATSLPAIKAFLQGERQYRRGQYDSARVHHARAGALDTSFALAYRRLGLELGWNPQPGAGFRAQEEYVFKAAALNHGLAPRDSLLIVAESLGQARDPGRVPASALVDLGGRMLATLAEAARRFPNDPEVWQAVGEAGTHYDNLASPWEAVRAFDRVIALDSGFTPAYEHVLQLALLSGDEQRAQRYAEAYLALRRRATPDQSLEDASIMLAAVLLTSRGLAADATAPLIDTIGVAPLWRAGLEPLGWWLDSAETAIHLFRALPRGRRSMAGVPDWVADTLMWPQYLALSLLNRGHVREAYDVYRPLVAHPPGRWAGFANPFRDLALLHGVPAATVAAVIARSPTALSSPRWLAWWFDRRDAGALTRVMDDAARRARQARDPVSRELARGLSAAAAGYLALLRGDSLAAIADLGALPDSVCRFVDCAHGWEQFKRAELLAARGDDRRAAGILDRWMWVFDGPLAVLARLARARIAERTGEPEVAGRYYAFVVHAWRHADPELHGYVTEAREGLRRLGAEPRR
jgi:serine/threonine-protein kinase